jgi:dTDP-4-amino-4,6-dideoxygalactose transaminase
LPSWTFAATAHATINANVVPSFVDVALNTWRANFSDKVINVVDVLPFGDNLDLNRIPNQIETLVIDGAASILGLASCGMLPSSKKVALIVSMHATKLLPAGEGAFFVTNSEEWSRKFRAWTNFGFGFEREAEFIATNAKLSEYAAAVALAAFDNMKLIDLKMSGIRKTALKISQHAGISVQPSMNKGFNTPYWILNLYSKEAKEKVVKRLNENKIVNREWWGIGCHKQIAFSGNLKSKLPNTDLLASTTLGIPFHLALRERDFNLIGNVLAELP